MAALMATTAALAACGGSDEATPTGFAPPIDVEELQEEIAALPDCDTTFVEGAVLAADTIRGGCIDSDGGVLLGSFWECEDDWVLLGDDMLWGFSDEPLVANEAAGDPAYADALAACREG